MWFILVFSPEEKRISFAPKPSGLFFLTRHSQPYEHTRHWDVRASRPCGTCLQTPVSAGLPDGPERYPCGEALATSPRHRPAASSWALGMEGSVFRITHVTIWAKRRLNRWAFCMGNRQLGAWFECTRHSAPRENVKYIFKKLSPCHQKGRQFHASKCNQIRLKNTYQ